MNILKRIREKRKIGRITRASRITLEQAKQMYAETGEYRYAIVVAGINVPIWLYGKLEDAEAKVNQHYEWRKHQYHPDMTDYYVKDLKSE